MGWPWPECLGDLYSIKALACIVKRPTTYQGPRLGVLAKTPRTVTNWHHIICKSFKVVKSHLSIRPEKPRLEPGFF